MSLYVSLAIEERLKQHRDNLELWLNGVLDPTVEDAVEKGIVMRDLRTAISELEWLKQRLGL